MYHLKCRFIVCSNKLRQENESSFSSGFCSPSSSTITPISNVNWHASSIFEHKSEKIFLKPLNYSLQLRLYRIRAGNHKRCHCYHLKCRFIFCSNKLRQETNFLFLQDFFVLDNYSCFERKLARAEHFRIQEGKRSSQTPLNYSLGLYRMRASNLNRLPIHGILTCPPPLERQITNSWYFDLHPPPLERQITHSWYFDLRPPKLERQITHSLYFDLRPPPLERQRSCPFWPL
ncbi:hypothetical protein CEXT_485741 [Caerostris extrusa]|uniref:Maturase K n=1 Tax=Caerostris extrusa TaxID=172846 RepID=A0AAV4VZZ0_CAEEX|nr:hypothetical protein CEXT_485741 [Caerostris extrusa]